MNAAPNPVAQEMQRTLSTLFDSSDVIELRAIHKGRKRVDAGYYDGEHRDALVEASAKLDSTGAAVYVTLNPLNPQLLARCANRVQDFAQATATDANVTRRRWLLIDVDPQRPKDTSATDAQFDLARERGRAIYSFLAEREWPKPVVAHSGNGVHLLYRIDLPNDDASRDLIKNVLEALAVGFDDAAVKVDRSVFNSARIVKLHGSIATKGDHMPSAPWRLSRLLSVPSPIGAVSTEQLKACAVEAAPAAQSTAPGGSSVPAYRAWTDVDMAAFLARGRLEATGPEPHSGAMRWKLKACPFNSDHGPGESAVFLRPDGRLGFDCKHSSCVDKHWKDLRALVDGERPTYSGGAPRTTDQANQRGDRDLQTTEVRVVTLCDVEHQPLRPLWPGKLWRGKSALLAGDPGLGKSLSTLDIAARITRGKQWPTSPDRAPIGDVIILSAEDDAADTLRPRLESAGADLSKIHVITEVIERPAKGEPKRRTFRLGTHLPLLERVFAERKPLLLIIDPITAYLSAEVDSHNTADVRSELAPLADLAQRHGVAVLMVSHLNKATTMQAIYRVTGSVAFVAAARSAFGVLKDPNDRERRLFLPLKNNLGKDTGGLAYRVVFDGRAPHIEWEPDVVDADIDEVTSGARALGKTAAVDEVSDWLRDQLRHGPVAASDLWRRAESAEHSERRVKMGLKALGAVSAPMGYAGAWHYSLPGSASESDKNGGTFSRPNLNDSDRISPTLNISAQLSESLESRTDSARVGHENEPGKVHDSGGANASSTDPEVF